MSRACSYFAAGCLLAIGSLILAGCGAEAAPVTAQTSKFRPDTPANAQSPPAETADPVAPPTELPVRSAPPRTAGDRPTPSGLSPAPNAIPRGAAEAPLEVPDGTNEELAGLIERLGKMEPNTQDERQWIKDVLRLQDARLTAVKKLLDQKPDDELRVKAVNAAFEVFAIQSKLGVPGTFGRLNEFATSLSKHKDPAVAREGRFLLFNLSVGTLVNKATDDGSEAVARIKQFLADERNDLVPRTFDEIDQVVDLLMGKGMKKETIAVMGLAGDAAAGSKDEKIATLENTYRDRVVLFELDLDTLLKNLLTDEKDAETTFVTSLTGALGKVHPTGEVARTVQQVCGMLDLTGHGPAALKCYDALEALFSKSTDKELSETIANMIANARKRGALVGQPFVVEGVQKDGQPFDWSAYKGKVVLVDFWATWCGPCIEEFQNIQRNFSDFHEMGFDVVGVNLDVDPQQVAKFLELQPLPWTIVTTQIVLDGKLKDEDPVKFFSTLPMAEKCGVDAIPFLVLVGKDGNVDSLHVRGPKLRSRLIALLGEPGDSPAADKPADKPAGEKPVEKPSDKPAEKPAAEAKAAEPKPGQAAITPVGLALAVALLGADEPAKAAPATADDPAINPYAAKPGLNTEQLVAYVLKMLDKPKTIQARPGFTDAVRQACDRVLSADPPPTEIQFFVVVEAKFETLHKRACTGDAAADKLLVAFVEKMKDDQRPRVARQVAFFQQERIVLDAVDGPAEKIPDLLKELQEYFAKEKLTARHLRMASSTVALINRLEDGDQREENFTTFGKTFATSSDKELSRYGKKLAQKPGVLESDLVGKPLELAGTTAKGANLVWEAYRGKVVLVDFWATWCGPCRREMPHVKALYEKLRDRSFEVVGVSLDEDQEALAAYLEENAIAWDTLAGEGTQDLADKYGVRGIPTMMLVDKEGKVVAVSHGVAPLEPLIEKLLGASGAASPAPAK